MTDRPPTLITTNLSQTFQALRNRDPLKMQNQQVPVHNDYKSIPKQNYAPIGSAHTGNWGGIPTRNASIANSNLIYGQPQFFSPIHTNINWQMPSKRIESYQWARFFYDTEPKVASAIDFYSLFPMSDWDHDCKDRKVKKYFDRLKTKLELPRWCRAISYEVHLLGDCFPFLEVECEHCGGHGKIGDEICEHEGGSIRRVVLLNPDYVDILSSPLNHEQTIVMRPDEELMTMITRKLPGHEKLHPELAKLILSGRPILLDKHCISHFRYGANQISKYGTGMVRRLFPILSYKTKLMMAQWTVAERLILPIKIVKVGSDERPAGPADIAAVQAQLAETANDPNLTIVTHHAFDLDYAGASGKILTISDQFEFIGQEILDGLMINQSLLNGDGPGYCLSDDSKVLTNNGLKSRTEIDINKDWIATFNKDNESIEYQLAIDKFEYDHNSIDGIDVPLKHFKTNKIDMLVTHNHKMLYAPRQNDTYGDWTVVNASEVKERGRFRGSIPNWNGVEFAENIKYCNVNAIDFLKIVGWYASYMVGISQSSKVNSEIYSKTKNVLKNNNMLKTYPSNKNTFVISTKRNKELVEFLHKNVGDNSVNKRIPNWIKSLDKKYLKILVDALVDGDAHVRTANKKVKTEKKYYSYTTVSPILRDDLIEMLIKLGFSPKFSVKPPVKSTRRTIYTINWSESEFAGRYPTLASRDQTTKPQKTKQVIFDVPYKGKVWCVEVPNHFIITERNGVIGIHGNSSAAVGQEAMIHRLTTFRAQMSEWIIKNIYLPEAKRQGFIDEDVAEDDEEVEYIVPKIKWHKMHLRDEQQHRTNMIQLYEKGIVSAHTLLETFELDPDQEIDRKRYDAIQMMALGQGVNGQTNDAGMGGMGGPPMGGGDMGGMGGGGPPMPDMSGGMGGPTGGDMGGAPPVAAGDGAPPLAKTTLLTAETINPEQFGGKILKKKTRERMISDQSKQQKRQVKHQEEVDNASPFRDSKGRIVYTKPERDLIKQLMQAQKDGIIKYPVKPQMEVTSGNSTYLIDFAILNLKIGIEADGEIFHSAPEQVKSDGERDRKLAQQGWTIIRFKEKEIENKIQMVMQKIYQTIAQKEAFLKNQIAQTKQGASDGEVKIAAIEHSEEDINESFEIIEKLKQSNNDLESQNGMEGNN